MEVKQDGHIRGRLSRNLKSKDNTKVSDTENTTLVDSTKGSRVVKGWKYFWFVTRYSIIGKFHCDLPFKTKVGFHIFRYIIILFLFFSIIFTISELNLAYMKTKGLLDWQGQPQAAKTLINKLKD